MRLPIDDVLPDLVAAIRAAGRAVLAAPPGAGKTTRVPLALLEAGIPGKIVLLEPRRLAARAAAARMAETLGEVPGATVGYRMRGETVVGAATRIEVVTEGILTRMIQSDPELTGVGAVIFDEFHERSLNADLGLALAWEVRGALRPDLAILVMSATLDTGAVAALLDGAPVVRSEGRSYPVETRWLETPRPKEMPVATAVADLVERALAETGGGVLAFLPGEGEIRRAAAALRPLPDGTRLHTLFGAMPAKDQRAAVAPEAARKVVLATAIAETSLTIEGIGAVVDGGLARRSRHDPATGLSRLVTEPVSRAEADQRRGRAGRVGPGVCYRNWTQPAEGALPVFAPPEITIADLAALALELAVWGTADLAFLTPPPERPMAAARDLLQDLGALDDRGRITAHGRRVAARPVHPRLGHMLACGGRGAARLAALLSDRDPMPEAGADLGRRLAALDRPDTPALRRIAAEARRLARHEAGPDRSPGAQAALAYPDRVGLARRGRDGYLLSGGRGAVLPDAAALHGAPLIVATDVEAGRPDARIRQAIALAEDDLRTLYGDAIAWHDVCRWSRRAARVEAVRQERYRALILAERPWTDAPAQAVQAALCDGIRTLGLDALGWTTAARLLRARARFAGVGGLADADLLADLEAWAAPFLTGRRTAADLAAWDPAEALTARIGWNRMREVDRLAPATWITPLGRKVAIDYGGAAPSVSVRLQEVFGTARHPTVGAGAIPLQVTLLSPAGRPVQVTQDLPGFWAGSYADVRKDMRARYPKHPWPEDPLEAAPTLRAKPRAR